MAPLAQTAPPAEGDATAPVPPVQLVEAGSAGDPGVGQPAAPHRLAAHEWALCRPRRLQLPHPSHHTPAPPHSPVADYAAAARYPASPSLATVMDVACGVCGGDCWWIVLITVCVVILVVSVVVIVVIALVIGVVIAVSVKAIAAVVHVVRACVCRVVSVCGVCVPA
jgi:hypothetical protein